jgi:hypothetical protein
MGEGQGQLFSESEKKECPCCRRYDGEHMAGCVNERKRPRRSHGLSTRTLDGIERARKHANPEWIALAKSILEHLARTREFFTTADVKTLEAEERTAEHGRAKVRSIRRAG